MTHVMVDLESWGLVPGSDLRSIGAVVFDPVAGTLGEEFYVNVKGGGAYHLTHHPQTVQWWMEQSEEAQQRLLVDRVDIAEGLKRFSTWWYAQETPDEGARFWAHGPHFDEVLLACAYRATDQKVPWHYRAPRDVRTILEAAGMDPKTGIPEYGVAHNALDDAKAQAMGVIEAYRRLRETV